MNRRIRVAERYLAAADPVLARLIEKHGPCTLLRDPKSHFHTLVWAIVNQQLSVRAAQSIESRLKARLGASQFEPRHFHRAREITLRACGLSGAKVRYLREISRKVLSGALDLQCLEEMGDQQAAEFLMQLPGIGRWTADMLLMFSLRRLDVLPLGDLALRKSIRIHHRLPEGARDALFLGVAEPWRPYRTVASWYYWAAVD
jgi:DNA-3-methyladenine glycosylase II